MMMIENKVFKIAILDLYNGYTNEGMRCIKKIIYDFEQTVDFQVTYTIFDVRQHLEIPDLGFDAFISTGGPGNPAPVGDLWERKFFKFLDNLLQYNSNRKNIIKKHLFLICHSFQMASIHWQLAHVSKRRKTSFGTFPVHKTAFGRKDPILSDLEDPFWIVDSRDYQVTQPNQFAMDKLNAKVLCMEKVRPNVNLDRAIMAFRFSNEIIGTQFHPEADAEGMLRYFLQDNRKEIIVNTHGLEKYESMIRHLNDPEKISQTEKTILPQFLRLAAAHMSHSETKKENSQYFY